MKKDNNIEIVCKETGWSREKAEEMMKHAKTLGMTGYRYVHNKVWKLKSDEDIRLLAVQLEIAAKIEWILRRKRQAGPIVK